MNTVPIESIVTNRRLRQFQPEHRDTLAESIRELGLLNPVIVTLVQPESVLQRVTYLLVAGLHRWEACKLLGWKKIPVTIITGMDAIDTQLAEIDENLVRAELTQLERANHLAKRKELYEERHPETKHGACGGGKDGVGTRTRTEDEAPASSVPSFAQDTAAKTNVSARTVQVDVRRATNITEETKEEIQDMPEIADNGAELDVLASLSPAEQKVAVEAVKSGEAKSIRQATGRTARSHKAKPSKVELPNDAVYQPTRIKPNPVNAPIVLQKPDFKEQSIAGEPLDWEGQCKHLDSLVTKQKWDIQILRDQVKELLKENQALKKQLEQIRKQEKKSTRSVAPFHGENCIKEENEPWDIDVVQPPDGLQDVEAVMPPPTPTDWKKAGKEYQTKNNILEDEIRMMRSTIRELKKDVRSWEDRAMKAETELSSIRTAV
ncbi:MAG: ParB N-terminal domain-containing protein [Magnetococcus sp. YQC-5]